jgi:lipopolysaccharide biosynthesis protein
MNMSDWLNSINYTKQDLLLDNPVLEKEYVPFIINRSLSYFPDTLFHCNEMNFKHFLTKKMQYDYLRHAVRKRKRFSKWDKKTSHSDMECVKKYYGYSNKKALEVLPLLTKEQITKIKTHLNTGGVNK